MPGKGLVECILFAELEGEEFHVDMEASAHVEQAEDIETGNAQLRSNQADVKYKALAEKMCEASANMGQVKTYQETHGPASSSKDATMGGPSRIFLLAVALKKILRQRALRLRMTRRLRMVS